MKILYFIIGIAIGSLATYFLFPMENSIQSTKPSTDINLEKNELNWKWPDSLDALVAAPKNHELIFENEQLRVLKVTVVPGVLDPIHTHKGKSLIWVTMTSPLLYHVYGYDAAKKLQHVRTDTINVKKEELFKGTWENPEPPHSVENSGKETFQLYRIEYKTKI